MKDVKKLGLDVVLALIKSGKNPAEISEDLDVPKQTLGYYVDKLKALKCIEKKGYGTWAYLQEVPTRPKGSSQPQSSDFKKKEIRGHAFIWKIEFLDGGYDWIQIVKNYKKKFKRPKLSFQMISRGRVPRTIFKGRKIWLTKTGLVIYEPLDFFGKSSFQVKGTAVFEMDRLIKDLIKTLGQKLQYYRFMCSREHFAHVKNQMARQFNENKKKIHVEYEGKHFWIDHSHGEHEEESDDTNVSFQAQKYYKDHVKTKFEVTPSFLLENMAKRDGAIKKNAEHLEYHAENMRSHVGAVNKLAAGVDKNNEIMDKMLRLLESQELNRMPWELLRGKIDLNKKTRW